MIKAFLILFFMFLCSSDGTVLVIENHNYSFHDFFARYPKKQWERADSLQKEKMIDGFIKRELCVLEAKRLGFQNSPDIAVKIHNRSLQALINESYEHFVAVPLLPQEDLILARINAKREIFVSHILVGHAGSYLGQPPQRTLDDALVLSQQIINYFDAGENFTVLAEKYSDDIGVKGGAGEVGWIRWGDTVPEFQIAAFSLEPGELSPPILTNFGYHLILVSDTRPSDFQYMDNGAYESLIINITKNSIRDLLKPAAIEYDKRMINEYGVVFNMDAVQNILRAHDRYQKNKDLSLETGSSSFLEAMGPQNLVCVYNKKGYGPKWFARRLDRIPLSRQPRLETEELIVSAFKTFILQDIAINKGFLWGIDSSFSYRWKVSEMVSGLLYDAYLKHLVNSFPRPDSLSIKDYYDYNKKEKFMEDEKITVREIKVFDRVLADSLLLLIRSGFDFSSVGQQYFSNNSGLIGPFSRKQDIKYFDAATLLSGDDISPVISTSNNSFSIIQLVERFPSKPLEFNRVYARIESLLVKEGQNNSKKNGVNVLLDRYSVEKNVSLLY